MAGSSTLHVLHQSLNQLKTSKVEIILIVSLCKQKNVDYLIYTRLLKLMQNELFRELYDEAKGHEKNVSLNQLVAGSKEFVIY